jgi:hypothetical protein
MALYWQSTSAALFVYVNGKRNLARSLAVLATIHNEDRVQMLVGEAEMPMCICVGYRA